MNESKKQNGKTYDDSDLGGTSIMLQRMGTGNKNEFSKTKYWTKQIREASEHISGPETHIAEKGLDSRSFVL